MEAQLWGREQAQAHASEIFCVYDAVFGDHPNEQQWRDQLYDRHCARDGFRLSVALDGDKLVGFAWGFVGQRGQYWPDRVALALPKDVTEEWVGGHFEFVELAVLPQYRGRGLGGRLTEAVLADMSACGARAVVLEADPADAPAMSFYARLGFAPKGTALLVRALPTAGAPLAGGS